MRTPFKMKGSSLYSSPLLDGSKKKGKLKTTVANGDLQKTNHPVTPPTVGQAKKSKGTLSKNKSIKFINKEHIKSQLKTGTFWVTPEQKKVVNRVKNIFGK